ncbi:hypothetical protein D9O50_05875 [Oxalobacteraceae bacterium CAVE-383]|nr:hypothetical protein D9O50_05875 [Oxalobacteraceae bacterium CAVE-383]
MSYRLHRPMPISGECIRGYLLRLTEENFIGHQSWLRDSPEELRIIRLNIGKKLHGRLGNLFQTKGEEQTSSASLSSSYFMRANNRCCPDCFRDMSYWRVEWEHRFYVACHIHKKYLIDLCPVCSAKLPWKRHSLGACMCGSRISDWSAMEGSKGALLISEFLALALAKETHRNIEGLDNFLISKFGNLTSNSFSALIHLFGTFAINPLTRRKSGSHECTDMEGSLALVNAASNILDGWPQNFEGFLKAIGGYQEGRGIELMPSRHFYGFANALHKKFSTPELRFVLRRYRSFVLTHWPRVLNQRNRWAGQKEIEEQPYVSVILAAKWLHISSQRVVELFDAGVLRGYARISTQGRKIVIIEKKSLSNADKYIADVVTLNGAAELLGLPRSRLDELVVAKIIRPRHDGPKDGVNRLFSRAEISRFIKKITSGQHEPSEEEDLISGPVILKAHLGKGEFVRLILDILERKLPLLCARTTDFGFRDLIFSRKGFFTWRKSIRNARDMTCTVAEAASKLGLKQEVAYHLVKKGLLKSRTQLVGKRVTAVVGKKHIQQFEISYLSASNMARQCETSPRSLIAKLASKNVVPVTGPGIDHGRQYFFKTEDISKAVKLLGHKN